MLPVVIMVGYAVFWLCVSQGCLTYKAVAEYRADTLLHIAQLKAGFQEAGDPSDDGGASPASRRLTIVPREDP
jgi:hypothetical protein